MSEAIRDQNHVTVALGQSSTSSTTTLPFKIDSSNGRLLVDLASGSGDVVGPASATDNAVVLFDGTTGKLIKDSIIKLASTVFSPVTSDGVSLGSGTLMWSDLFLASGAVINIANSNWVATHTSGILTVGTGDLRVTTVGTNSASVVTVGGVATLTSKTITASSNVLGGVTMTLGSDADGDVYYRASNVLTRLPKGTAGQVLTMNAGATAPEWAAAGGVPTTITVANEATDTSCFIAFFTAATGDLGPKTNVNMTFDSSTGIITLASSVLTTTDINGGTIDGTSIGATSASTIVGTTITANTSFLPDADGGAALGSATLGFSILGLASASTINWANGNAVLTHSSGILTISTGDLRVTTAGSNSASVVTVGGTQTLTAKTLTSPTINAGTLSGIFTLAESTSIDLDPAQGDQTWTGITRTGTAGATLAFGDLCYLAAADSRWELTDADSVTTADRLLGMCVLAAASDGDPTRMLLMGNIRADSKFPAMTIGSAMYISDATAGAIITTIPTGADNVIRRVGYALTADELYFNPSMDSQTTVA